MDIKSLIKKLYHTNSLYQDELLYIIKNIDNTPDNSAQNRAYLYEKACLTRNAHYENKVFLRGLIELSNYCKNDCYYCGIRCSNKNVERYRLSKEDVLSCCEIGYKIGYRTFVIQSGEDPYFTEDKMCEIISSIKQLYPDCAITLSIGEKDFESYKNLFESGADRYLLRHETSNANHYNKLHPSNLTIENRKECLNNLKSIGYQVGAGLMVDSPYQEDTNLVEDLLYLKELNPHMVGIGPFIPHQDTPFKDYPSGRLDKTLLILALTRLLLPDCLLPATTALASIDSNGRNAGLMAGCNVIMPNLSPMELRNKYSLYDNKLSTGEEACEYHNSLEKTVNSIGLKIDYSRGDNINWRNIKCL
ncbi:[FeFe] hydrogenase H-cluster radical SAM maturase HydE [Romboutsia sp.]|uniref:[FeFe] hydrogenase H-cluster radical SAM maturase HydE n=1 Tax=Romboutsia sp. TaxID=1965302 RepID=UPI003F4151BC